MFQKCLYEWLKVKPYYQINILTKFRIYKKIFLKNFYLDIDTEIIN